MASLLERMFGKPKVVIGMAHFGPLPGTPFYDKKRGINGIFEDLLKDVTALQEGGIDGILFCNEGDRPYVLKAAPEVIATMASSISRLRAELKVPFGVDVLWDPKAAIAIAKATGASFVREVFTGVYAGDMGLWLTNAGEALRYRAYIDAEHVKCFFNINAEFAGPLGQRPVEVIARSVVVSSVPDAILISGPMTGYPPRMEDLAKVREVVPENIPVICNTGVTHDTVKEILQICDGVIVGTALKAEGITWMPVDKERVKRFMEIVEKVR